MKTETVVMSMMGMVVAGWTAEYIASALGKGQSARMIGLVTNLLCFTTAVGTIGAAIAAFRKVLP